MAYKVFFCAVPDNRHSSTTWAGNRGFLRGLSDRTRAGEPGERPACAATRGAPVRPSGQPMMRLVGSDLACVRGGRQVFPRPELRGRGRRSPGRDRPQRRRANPRCFGWSPAWSGRPRGGLTLEGGDPELTIGEQAHYLGHQDALKPSLTVRENLAFWARFLGGEAAPRRDAALAAVGLDGLAHLPAALSLRRAAAAALARPADRGRAADLAARRADHRARHRGAGHARRAHARASRRRRAHPGRRPWTDRARPGAGAAAGSAP